MPSSGEPGLTAPERRRKQMTARLLEAIEQLAADGETYASISVDKLASHAGISRATFYLYFPEKRALLSAWLDGAGGFLNDALAEELPSDGAPTLAELTVSLGRIADGYRTRAALIEAVYHEAALKAETRSQLDRLVDDAVCTLREHIERGQCGGWVDSALLPAETATWLIWALQSGLRDLIASQPADEVERLVDAQADIWWHVLYV